MTDHEVQIFINGQDKTLLMPPPEPGASVAMVTCRPTTLQTYQIKGRFRNLRPATAIELDWITGPIDRMVLEFAKIDLPEERSRAYFSFAPNDLMVLSFEPTAAFDQTPGPNAGARLPGYSA